MSREKLKELIEQVNTRLRDLNIKKGDFVKIIGRYMIENPPCALTVYRWLAISKYNSAPSGLAVIALTNWLKDTKQSAEAKLAKSAK
jgi:acyl-coenzyme A synthetase/AMP-(fatty) acid ligase